MEVKIHKTVRLKAKVLGLDATSFLLFLGVSIVGVLILVSNLSINIFLIVAIIISVVYMVLYAFQSYNISDIFSKLPKTIVNK